MCGIVGILNRDESPVRQEKLVEGVKALKSRGPDANGTYVDRFCGLGHTRLAIIDLQAAANQPMHGPDREMSIVFNGEIYNFAELRKELEAEGARFRTESDTEVVLVGYQHWGEALFRRLNGIFAFAIWCKRDQRLVLVRDRLGIKPLYVCETERSFYFASEPKGILSTEPNLPRRLSRQAFGEFLYFGVPLSSRTMFDGIEQVPPGTFVVWEGNRRREERYWHPSETEEQTVLDGESLILETRNKIEQAVKRQLVADVPVSIFLSGGIDSSAIAAFAARHYQGKLTAFSASFDFNDLPSEARAAKNVAKQFGLDHHELEIAGSTLPETIERLVEAHDAPFADAANLPLFLMCEKIRGSFKVVLQGDGGDELFGGYNRYPVLSKLARWRLFALMTKPFRFLFDPKKQRFLECFDTGHSGRRMGRLLTMEQESNSPWRILTEPGRQWIDAHDPMEFYMEMGRLYASKDAAQAMLYTDLSIILPNVFLEKVDKATMASSVEARVPLLDNELVTHALSIPSKHKLGPGTQKWLLKKSLEGVVPHEILYAKKRGFGVPYGNWLGGPLWDFLNDQLSGFLKDHDAMVSRPVVEQLLRQKREGGSQHDFLLWKLLNLAIWFKQYRVSHMTS